MEKLLLMVLCVSAFLLPGCRQTAPEEEQESPPPEEAALFADLTLSTPLKAYGDGNPVMTQRFGADPYAIVYEDRMYLYMTGDTIRYSGDQVLENNYSNINTIRVLSSSDLVNWTEHPEIKAAGSNGAAKWANNSWAPAAAYKEVDGIPFFFVYFADSANGIGVLRGYTPTGPFTDPIGKALINRSTPNCNNVTWLFDPAVLVDDDGRAYIYFGGGTPDGGSTANFDTNHPLPGTDRVVELGADMTSIIGTPQSLNVPFIFEDSGINKIGNAYYYSYCSNTQVHHYATRPEQFPEAALIGKSLAITYMTGTNPLGPYVLQKMILPNPGDFPILGVDQGNNHHCMVEFKSKWYIVYHSRLLEAAMGLTGTGDGYRITSIDEVRITNGVIEEIGATRSGVAQSGRFNPYYVTDAATFGVMAGLSTEEYQRTNELPRMRVTGIDTGDWLALHGVDFGSTGAKKFNCRVNPPASGKGVIQIRQDSLTGKPIGYVIIEAGQESDEITVDLLRTVKGVHDLVFVFYGEGYSFEQWKFVR